MEDGAILIFFLIVLFFLWLLVGGSSRPNVDKPFIKIHTQDVSPDNGTSVQMQVPTQ